MGTARSTSVGWGVLSSSAKAPPSTGRQRSSKGSAARFFQSTRRVSGSFVTFEMWSISLGSSGTRPDPPPALKRPPLAGEPLQPVGYTLARFLHTPHVERAGEDMEGGTLTSQRLLDILRHSPGVPLCELAKRAELASGTLYYHLRRLRAAGHLQVVPAGRRRLAFLATGDEPTRLAPRLAQLRGKSARKTALIVLRRPGIRLADIAAETGLSRRAVAYHLRRLEELGLASTVRERAGTRARPAPVLADLLREEQEALT